MRPLTAALVALAALLTSCRGHDHSPETPPDQTYDVRGVLKIVPRPGALRKVEIFHEPIPSFVDETGAVVGMDAMAMPFMLADSVSVEGFAIGDKVAFTFEVRWKADHRLLLTKLTKLDPETRLELD